MKFIFTPKFMRFNIRLYESYMNNGDNYIGHSTGTHRSVILGTDLVKELYLD